MRSGSVHTRSNFLKPRDFFMYRQVQPSEIPLGSHNTFMCLVRISEQTATLALHDISTLVLCNGGGECLQRCKH